MDKQAGGPGSGTGNRLPTFYDISGERIAARFGIQPSGNKNPAQCPAFPRMVSIRAQCSVRAFLIGYVGEYGRAGANILRLNAQSTELFPHTPRFPTSTRLRLIIAGLTDYYAMMSWMTCASCTPVSLWFRPP